MTPYLVIGSEGQIGDAICREFSRRGLAVVHADLGPRSISNYIELDQADELRLLSGAYQGVVFCSSPDYKAGGDPVAAFPAWAYGIVDGFGKKGTPILFLSTNSVFDGLCPLPEPDVQRSPIDLYGQHKADLEELILLSPMNSVLRLTKVLGPNSPPFVPWLDNLRRGGSISAFANFYIAPVPLSLVVQLSVQLILGRQSGIFHLSADSEISFAETIQAIAAELGIDPSRVEATEANPRLIARVGRSARLGNNTLQLLGLKSLDPQIAIQEFVRHWRAKFDERNRVATSGSLATHREST